MTSRVLSFVLRVTAVAGLTVAAPPGVIAQPPRACCIVTAIDAQTGVATARDNASGNVFEFRARTPAMLAGVRVGQAVHANFSTNRVSLDGRTTCCTITRAPAAVGSTPKEPPSRIGGARGAAGAKGAGAAGAAQAATQIATFKRYDLPQISYGEPIQASAVARSSRFEGRLPRVATRVAEVTLGGRRSQKSITHIRGAEGIRNSRLPDGAKRLLEMHVRKLQKGESEYYLVDEQLAAQWMASHPEVPPEVKPKEEKKKDEGSGCGMSNLGNCASDPAGAVNDAVDAVEAEFERARERADDWWKESTETLADLWNETANCFTDHRLPGPKFPVRFSKTKSMSVDMKQGSKGGATTGEVTGTLTIGVPVSGDFEAKVDFFYVPCLPFVFRPRSLSADGEMTVGHELAMELAAAGAFKKRFTLPPTGGPQIPLYVIPIVIGSVPVAVIDVSLYLEGEVDVNAEGKANGRFSIANSHNSKFEFECNGSGCEAESKGSSAPSMSEHSAQIEGEVSVQPGMFVALQLSFDYNVLQGRAGPQPYLLGVANGCIGGSMSQASGSTVSTASQALTADLDWGVKLRAEALSGGQRLGKRWQKQIMEDRHLWFRDLAPGGSSAFVATAVPPAQAAAGQPVTVLVRMPSCYPYTEAVHYRVSWTGGATAAPISACTWQGTSGTCRYAPNQPLPLRFTWQTPGAHSVTIQPFRDAHPRTFSPSPAATTITVNVVSGGGGGDEGGGGAP